MAYQHYSSILGLHLDRVPSFLWTHASHARRMTNNLLSHVMLLPTNMCNGAPTSSAPVINSENMACIQVHVLKQNQEHIQKSHQCGRLQLCLCKHHGASSMRSPCTYVSGGHMHPLSRWSILVLFFRCTRPINPWRTQDLCPAGLVFHTQHTHFSGPCSLGALASLKCLS